MAKVATINELRRTLPLPKPLYTPSKVKAIALNRAGPASGGEGDALTLVHAQQPVLEQHVHHAREVLVELTDDRFGRAALAEGGDREESHGPQE